MTDLDFDRVQTVSCSHCGRRMVISLHDLEAMAEKGRTCERCREAGFRFLEDQETRNGDLVGG